MEDRARGRLLDGALLARKLREQVRAEVAAGWTGPPPRLRALLLGHDPASEIYVASKERAAREAGLAAETVRLSSSTSPEALLAEIRRANLSESVDGILVQLPLGPQHEPRRVFDTLHPLKDVDGFHPENVGLLHQGRPRFTPCTPAGILALLDEYRIPLAGRRVVVIGRSDTVGKPLAALLTSRDATVTLCHSKTRDLPALCAEAALLVSAIGRPGFVTRDFVGEGAVVVDVGVNRLDSLDQVPQHLRGSSRIRSALAEKGRAVIGDVDFDSVSAIASFITPVPGGIGPLTVAMLLRNTVAAARLRRSEYSEMDPLTL